MSIDKSNSYLLDEYPDLPIAFVYTKKEDLPLLESQRECFEKYGGSILPVKQGVKLLDDEVIGALPKWTNAYTCPIDKGTKKIGNNHKTGEWNCTRCDKGGGVGCFFKRTAKKLREQYERDNHYLRKESDFGAETGTTRTSPEGIFQMPSANLPIRDINIRGELLRIIRESGVQDADTERVLLARMVDWVRGRMESRIGGRHELGETENPDAARLDRKEGEGGGKSKLGDGDIIQSHKEEEEKEEPQFSIDAFHGSAADFNKVDLSFLGTGEGSQVFGYGFYASQVSGTGRIYADIAYDNAKQTGRNIEIDAKLSPMAISKKQRFACKKQ